MSAMASRPVADAVDVSFTDDELIVTLADARRDSAPSETRTHRSACSRAPKTRTKRRDRFSYTSGSGRQKFS